VEAVQRQAGSRAAVGSDAPSGAIGDSVTERAK